MSPSCISCYKVRLIYSKQWRSITNLNHQIKLLHIRFLLQKENSDGTKRGNWGKESVTRLSEKEVRAWVRILTWNTVKNGTHQKYFLVTKQIWWIKTRETLREALFFFTQSMFPKRYPLLHRVSLHVFACISQTYIFGTDTNYLAPTYYNHLDVPQAGQSQQIRLKQKL